MPPPIVLVERWKWVKGYRNYYRVSSRGRLKSVSRLVRCRAGGLRKTCPRFLKPALVKGYWHVHLSKKGQVTHYYVHQLIVEAFLPPEKNKSWVNHKNGIKTDNRLKNLERSNQQHNTNHAVKYGLVAHGVRISNAKLNDKKARKIFLATGLQKRIAETFGVSKMTVSLIKRRKIWRRATEMLK